MFTFKDIGVVPSNPPAGYVGLYCNGGVLYWIDEAGVTTSISSGTGDLKADGTIPLTANWDVGAFTITALQFHSDIATGTAPFTVASTTVVANLNADKLDGADLIDEDNMASDSDVHVPTQQSVKAYADGLVATALFDADFSAAGRMYTDGAGTYSVIKDLFSTVTPTVNTDSTSGYGVGSIIINTTGDGSVFICLDASVGAAVWMVVPDSADLGDYAYLQANIGATAAPTAGDDDLDGYSEGSMWLDTTNDKIYFCLDASTGAAVWREVGASELFTVDVETVADQDYVLWWDAPWPGTVTLVRTKSQSGTCTLTGKINTTALGGTANSVSSSAQEQAHSSDNTFVKGDKVLFTVSGNSSCTDMAVAFYITRTG